MVGAGQRGLEAYGPYALRFPGQLRFVAVAEPDEGRRAKFANLHGIPAAQQFESWEALFAEPQLGEAALICTQDWQHTQPTLMALESGYHVLLEKPMATTRGDCQRLIEASEAAGRQLHICHVLRYTRHFQKMKEIVQSGALGQIVHVSHRENVSWWHMAHSYVRGHWAKRAHSSPMILAKCCHDFDILLWLLELGCQRLSSIGGLTHFRPENAPPDAPQRCLDGCPIGETCPYYAPFVYLELLPLWRSFAATASGMKRLAALAQQRVPGLVKVLSAVAPPLRQLSDYRGWPRSVVADEPSAINLRRALETGPYGRCVYHCDNDVVDHQVVAMQFEGDLSVTLTMHGHSHIEGRTTRIEGSRATLQAMFGYGGSWIEVNHHRSDRRQRYDTSASAAEGHGGGDFGLMAAFLESLRGDGIAARHTARQVLESHLMAFAADQARLEGEVVEMESLR